MFSPVTPHHAHNIAHRAGGLTTLNSPLPLYCTALYSSLHHTRCRYPHPQWRIMSVEVQYSALPANNSDTVIPSCEKITQKHISPRFFVILRGKRLLFVRERCTVIGAKKEEDVKSSQVDSMSSKQHIQYKYYFHFTKALLRIFILQLNQIKLN